MSKVRNILEEKGSGAFTVEPDTMVIKALEMMMQKNIGGLLVTERENLVGIFTERDYARKVVLKGKSSHNTPVRDLMTPNPITVSLENTIEDCMQLMTDKHIRHLPVVTEDEKLLGLISIGDVVSYVIREQRYIIEHLEHYIKGS